MGHHGGKALVERLGVDITAVARVQALCVRRPDALLRLFTAGELADAGAGRQRWPRLASRFAAKEAVIKAAGGLRGSRYHDIEVRRVPGQAPQVAVYGPLADWLGTEGFRVQLSLSHEEAFAVAMVLLIPAGDDN